jgi:hypothetical protein
MREICTSGLRREEADAHASLPLLYCENKIRIVVLKSE